MKVNPLSWIHAMNITLGSIMIMVSGAVLWLFCFLKARDFMKSAGQAISDPTDGSPGVSESRRAEMKAFHRASSWANLAAFATIFLTMTASQIYFAVASLLAKP
jgi:hypothetical protein